MEYPKVKKGCIARVIAHCTNGRAIKAMFYWNGRKPTFASYGTDITESVVSWEYNKGEIKK